MKLNIGLISVVAFFFLQMSAFGQRSSLIYSSNQGIQQIELNSVQTPVQIISPKVAGYVTKIDLDTITNTLYWVEKISHRIMGAYINGSSTRNLFIGSRLQPYDIAVDSYGGQLYFTDSLTNQIYVYNLKKNRMVGAIVSRRLRKLRSIVLYPEKGLMFWTEIKTKGWQIQMALMNGKAKKGVVKKSLGRPVELAIDSQQERLYWIDSKLKVIEYIGLKGLRARRRKLVTRLSVPSKPVGLVVFRQKLIWMDRYFKVILTTNKNDESSKTIVKQHVIKPRGIIVWRRNNSEVLARDHPCTNHNCSHLCFASRNGVVNCACPKKMTLNRKDKRTCSAERICGHGEFRCRRSKECIFHSWKCDGSADCNDRSDEENCQVCNAGQFKCQTGGECVAKTAVCDGEKDCTDWSDEEKCNKLQVSCPDYKFTCTNGNCIERQWVCDKLDDCEDNSDEQNC